MPIEQYIQEKGRAVWIKDLQDAPEFQTELKQNYVSILLRDFGNAIGTPAFGPGGVRGTYVFFCPEVEQRPDESFMSQIEYLSYRFLLKFRDLKRSMEVELLNKITPRETDILNLLPHGLSNKQIALKLSLSPNTVDGYLKTIFIKLDVQDRMAATMRWLSMTSH